MAFPGEDYEVPVRLTLEEAFRGSERTVQLDGGSQLHRAHPARGHRRPAAAAARQRRPGRERRPAGRPLPEDHARAARAFQRQRPRPRPRGAARAVGSRARRPDADPDARRPRDDEGAAGLEGRAEAAPAGKGLPKPGGGAGDLYAVLGIACRPRSPSPRKNSTRSCAKRRSSTRERVRVGMAPCDGGPHGTHPAANPKLHTAIEQRRERCCASCRTTPSACARTATRTSPARRRIAGDESVAAPDRGPRPRRRMAATWPSCACSRPRAPPGRRQLRHLRRLRRRHRLRAAEANPAAMRCIACQTRHEKTYGSACESTLHVGNGSTLTQLRFAARTCSYRRGNALARVVFRLERAVGVAAVDALELVRGEVAVRVERLDAAELGHLALDQAVEVPGGCASRVRFTSQKPKFT